MARERVPEQLKREPFRPAYTDETLAYAIAGGIGANDKELSWLMPRYDLDDESMKIMVNYLNHLSAAWSPGVDDEILRFATVVTGDVSPEDGAAMYDTLTALFQSHDNKMRLEVQRRDAKLFYRQEHWAPYRESTLW